MSNISTPARLPTLERLGPLSTNGKAPCHDQEAIVHALALHNRAPLLQQPWKRQRRLGRGAHRVSRCKAAVDFGEC